MTEQNHSGRLTIGNWLLSFSPRTVPPRNHSRTAQRPRELLVPIGERVEQFVYHSRRWKLISVLFAVTLFKTGIWFNPILLDRSRLIAQNPFANPLQDLPTFHYLYWSWLAPFVAWLVGATGPLSFFCFHLFFSLAFTGLFIVTIFSRFEDKVARTALVMFFILPVAGTCYFWVGGDSVTLFLMMLALAFPKYLWATLIAGVALGMEHFEQGFFAVVAVAFVSLFGLPDEREREYSWRWALPLLFGIMLGKAVLVELFRHLKVLVNSGRVYWLANPPFRHMVVRDFYFHFQFIIYSVLGVGWALVIKYANLGKKVSPFFVALCGLMLLLPITYDETRVGAIVSFPLMAVFFLLNRWFLKSVTPQFLSWMFIAWLLVPYSWAYGGVPQWSILPYDVALMLHKLFGWFDLPTNDPFWPISQYRRW